MKKGISPLIAVVLLIAFTVIIAGIVIAWIMNFTRTTTTTVGQQVNLEIVCSYAGISLENLKYSSPYLSGNVENTGSVSIGNITLTIIYTNASAQSIGLCSSGNNVISCSVANLSLIPRQIVSFNVSISGNYQKIRVTTNCTNAYDEVSSSDVS